MPLYLAQACTPTHAHAAASCTATSNGPGARSLLVVWIDKMPEPLLNNIEVALHRVSNTQPLIPESAHC